MLLSRFTDHFSNQNWFAVGLDVIVVVVGIFLGMQMTEWNEQRKDNLEEKKLPEKEETENKRAEQEQPEEYRRLHLNGMYENWFLDYASYVILERAVPEAVDGLKPVQRRILHAMSRLDDGRLVRYLGIDAPELRKKVGGSWVYDPQPFAEEAEDSFDTVAWLAEHFAIENGQLVCANDDRIAVATCHFFGLFTSQFAG